MSSPAQRPDGALSIGDLSVACGISPHTLRVWERRYGRPEALRLPSGHRRYSSRDVPWLRQVHELLAYGHRPSALLAMSAQELEQTSTREREARSADPRVRSWLAEFRRSGPAGLQACIAEAFQARGPRHAVARGIACFMEEVGREWAEGQLTIAQEHAITEVTEDALRRERQKREGALSQSELALLLATPSGERHGLGLQMAALAATEAGARTLILGVDLPVSEIAQATVEHGARAAGISVSLAYGGPEAGRQVQELRDLLPSDLELLVGGLGARAASRGVPGVRVLGSLEDLAAWAAVQRPAGA